MVNRMQRLFGALILVVSIGTPGVALLTLIVVGIVEGIAVLAVGWLLLLPLFVFLTNATGEASVQAVQDDLLYVSVEDVSPEAAERIEDSAFGDGSDEE